MSKVRVPRTEAKACAKYDLIFTNNADGSHIDSSVLAGLQGSGATSAAAFLIPTGAIFAVLLGLVILKHTFLLTGRGVRYAASSPSISAIAVRRSWISRCRAPSGAQNTNTHRATGSWVTRSTARA